MSYCRQGEDDSDVYAYAHAGGGYESWGIFGMPRRDFTLADFRATMMKYRDAGETVPDDVFERIDEELALEEKGND